MKRIVSIILAFSLLLVLISCQNENSSSAKSVDVDLTRLSGTMVYSEVYNMLENTESYLGKTVRMRGRFSVYRSPDTGIPYFACVIEDATACCSQGLEFVLDGAPRYPDDYPSVGTEITVSGEFGTYEEGGYRYCHLIRAKFE